MSKNSKESKNKTIHSKFFISMSSISIMFLVFLFLITSIIFYKYFLELETNAALRQLDYISSQFDYYLTSAKNYSKTIIVDSNVQEYMTNYHRKEHYFNALGQMNVKNQISRIVQSTSFVHSVTIYSPKKELVITTEPFPIATDFNSTPNSSLGVWTPSTKRSKTDNTKEIQTLSFIRPFYNYDSGTLIGFIEIIIPEQMISKIYNDKSTNSSQLFLTDSFGTIQSSDGSLSLGGIYELFPSIAPLNFDNYQFVNTSIIFTKYFPTLDWYIINQINLFDFIKPTLPLFLITLIVTIACILACLYVSHKVSISITSPIARLVAHTKTIKAGDWTPLEEISFDTEIGQLLSSFNSMITAQEKLKNDLLEAQKMKTKISLDLLQQQVNPHFLYNTLDNICSLAEIDEKKTLIDLVMNLSTFYREGLSNGKFYITLKEELEITEAYLHIMQIRYFNKLDYSIHCPKLLWGYPCLKLLLQPIVENSIYHGIKELEDKGYIEIIVTEVKEGIQLIVQDNGKGLIPGAFSKILEQDSDHFGIKNIHQRIQLYYGESYGLTMVNGSEGGCRTIITIGKEAKEHADQSFIGG